MKEGRLQSQIAPIRYVTNLPQALELQIHFGAAVLSLSLLHSHSITYNLTNSLSENFLCLSLNMITNVSLVTVIFLVEFMWLQTPERFMQSL